MDEIFLPDDVIARMNALRSMIRPWVQSDMQKLVTMDQFERAMTTDIGGGRGGPGGSGGGIGSVPGLEPLITARLASVKSQLAAAAISAIASAPRR